MEVSVQGEPGCRERVTRSYDAPKEKNNPQFKSKYILVCGQEPLLETT